MNNRLRLRQWIVGCLITTISIVWIRPVLAEQQTFVPAKDNTIYEDSNNSNGSGERLVIGKYGGGEAVSLRRALLQFDLTLIPTNAVVSYAQLEVWVDEVEFISPQSQSFQLHRLNRDWGEGASNDGGASWSGVPAEAGDATWNHRFYDSQFWDESGGDYLLPWSSHTSIPADADQGLVRFPGDFVPIVYLVEDIQLWVNYPETNFGWIMHSDFSFVERAVAISSRESIFSVRRPRLTVIWSFPIEENGLSLVPVATNLNWPLGVTNAGDGSDRLFDVEQDGAIRILDPTAGLLETPFLDISAKVLSPADGGHVEQGLLGLAFHPDYPATNQFFVNYTYDPPGKNLNRTRVSRFSVSEDSNVALTDESVIMEFEQDDDNNNGGDLHFGPDGNLYIATGDGGGFDDQYGNGQNLFTPKGKILRINVDGVGQVPEPCGDTLVQNYTVPPDGFYSGEGDGCDEILHVGLRNPWRFSIDPKTKFMYIGDVGQDQFEEVNVSHTPSDPHHFGWACEEGRAEGPSGIDSCMHPILLVSSPQLVYPHVGGNCAVIGGYVYRGSATSLQGLYVYGDSCSGTIWFADYLDFHLWPNRWDNPNVAISNLASFGQDERCELYVVDRGEAPNSGAVYRIDDSERISTLGFEMYDCR